MSQPDEQATRVTMPTELYERCRKAAKAEMLTYSAWARRVLADEADRVLGTATTSQSGSAAAG